MAQAPANMEAVFDGYFRRADLDKDGRISGAEAVSFFQGSNLPKHVLAQIWMHADQNRTGFLGRPEFYNALRLVTVAQSGRELTPDLVKAALFSPAASKIPPPQINQVAAPSPQPNSVAASSPQLNPMAPPAPRMGALAPNSSQNLGFRGSQAPNQQFFPSPDNQFMRPPQASSAAAAAPLPMQSAFQGFPGGGGVTGPRPSGSNISISNDWFGRRPGGASPGVTSQIQPNRGIAPSSNQDGFGLAASSVTPSAAPPRPQIPSAQSSSISPKMAEPVLSSLQSAAMDSKALVVSGDGSSSNSAFGGDVFSVITQPKKDDSAPTFSASSAPNSSSVGLLSTGTQSLGNPSQFDPMKNSSVMPPASGQLQQAQSLVKQNQLAIAGVSVGNTGSVSSQSQLPWPKFTPSDIQKYTKVFVEVDKDRDGRITGEEARNLFLSWRLPREVLKQVWDLSDQDNDSMLTIREFCTALYLMERYREGRPLPSELPNSIKFDEALLRITGQSTSAYGNAAWQQTSGYPQQGMPGVRASMPAAGMRPPAQVSVSQREIPMPPVQQRGSRFPVLEKQLVNQLSKEEQGTINTKYQEATEADRQVEQLENEILDSKEKVEFYRTKMQDLVLYKSRCDNRLNEITERASADKREAETLAKKYEEKYKQVGDVASKLTVEEATFRDIQERKLELYNAIIKMEQGGSADGLLQVRADRIQSDLEELVKALNERCKRHGLSVKPMAVIELPFGWQPGIQEGAADWDEDWDKFEDEGFTIDKELTVEAENVIASPRKPKAPVWSDKASADGSMSPIPSSSNINSKIEKPSSTGEQVPENGSIFARSEDGSVKSPPGSPFGRSTLESPRFDNVETSPRAKGNISDHGGIESTISGDKFGDESAWGGAFSDMNDDVDSVWGFNAINSKESNSYFGSSDFGLNPIRTDSPSASSVFGKEKSPFFDSVPSTPLFNSSASPKYSQGPDDTYDSFKRFESFNMNDGGLFGQRESLARFDSIRSSAEFDHNGGFSSFDDKDPFGTSGPFTSSESQTSRRASDHWSAF
ncbi:hypothetical protein QJS10_CPB18g00695 [Acorus calamus]|uniref:Uncharacterized protein n=1 Tax=Acorus calamus TaxID=4465 RepID=A0AAV9CQP5_ACOCL|nr:hypothetical protein QJS10_CPB18g00695 [Acorus calamus]